MQNQDFSQAPTPEARMRREVLTVYGFAAFFIIVLIALGVDAVISYA